MEEEEAYIVCYPIAQLPTPALESYKAKCSECAQEVWRAKSSPHNLPILCVDCFIKKYERGGEIEVMHPTLQQLIDIHKYRKHNNE